MLDLAETVKQKIKSSKENIINHFIKIAGKQSVEQAREKGKKAFEYLMILPQLIVLVSKITLDSRVPKKVRIFAGSLIAYVVSPFDIIPEFIAGPIGFIDDLYVVALGLHLIIKTTDPNIIREHWKGDQDILSLVQEISSYGEYLLPKKVLERIETWLNKKGGELMIVETDK